MGKGGRNSEEREDAKPASLLSQPAFEPFQQPDFNVAEFTSRVLAGSRTTAQSQADELKTGVRQLEHALAAHVLSSHEQLLQHSRRLVDTEHVLQDVSLSISSLQASVNRIRAEIEGPYSQIKTKAQQLQNLQRTVELLRHLVHRIKLTHKLKQQLAAPQTSLDLAKAAKLLTDINAVSKEADLSGLNVADAESDLLSSAGADIKEQAQAVLVDGMESLSQAKVGSALQVYFNLEQLQQCVDGLLSRHVHDLERSIRQSLDSRHVSMGAAAAAVAAGGSGTALHHHASGPGGARGVTSPNPGAAGSWQNKLWDGLKAAIDTFVSAAVTLWHVQRVVAKKRDPLSHVLFLDVLCPPGSPLLTDRFWTDALRVLSDAFTAVSRPAKGGFVREALTANYPKLAALLEAAFQKLMTDTRVKGVAAAVAPDQLPGLLATAAPFRDAYLATALGRMQDAVSAAFAGGGRALPSPADVQKCIGCMHEELKAAGSSAQLAGQIGGVVGKTLRLLAEKAEYMAAAGPELRVLSFGPGSATAGAGAGGGPIAAQARNIMLCSQLQEVHRSLSTLLPRLPHAAAIALQAPMDALQATAIDVVAPMFRAALEQLESHILAMHSMDWDAGEAAAAAVAAAEDAAGGGVMTTSAYVNDVARTITLFKSENLSKFAPPPSPAVPSAVSSLAEQMAGRLLSFFVRQAALLRPLGAAGKLQLAKDMGELQLSVGQGLYPLEALGPAHRCLRAFRALLFTADAEVASSPHVRELPPSMTLHHLFSRLPASIPAPHERSGLTPAQYSHWLDQHGALDVLNNIHAALEAAGPATSDSLADDGQKQVYQFMLQLSSVANRSSSSK